MMYYKPEKDEEGLYLTEETYDPRYTLKTESVFAQCNGFFGVRASCDCRVLDENRGMFVGGLYGRAYESEAAELVNCPDLTEVRLTLDGEAFSLDRCRIETFRRRLNLLTGELQISAECEINSGIRLRLESRRFASRSNPHLYCQNFCVTPLNRDVALLEFVSGINGQVTNSGVSHFRRMECRVFEEKIMSLEAFLDDGCLRLLCGIAVVGGRPVRRPVFGLKRRGICETDAVSAERNQTVSFTKYSYVGTGRPDGDEGHQAVRLLLACMADGYRKLYTEHKGSMDGFWKEARIQIDGATPEEEAAVCFAQYHLMGMTPRGTSAYSVAAKGLTGEGYRGHVFWDTELFILPFFLYVFPEQAEDLLIYRFNGLPGAREKAAKAGFRGAMFPWEAAKDGREETPAFAQLNIRTGKANPVWSGLEENHVTADIAYAVWNCFSLTGDRKFMTKYGVSIILEAAEFWVSRAEYDPERDRCVIRNVIGPDEYDEHVDNNAYTNYMACFCVKTALRLLDTMRASPELRKEADWSCLEKREPAWRDFVRKIYLPKPDKQGIIPQDDAFLQKPKLPGIEKYRASKLKQSILLDYSRDEVVGMQVLKQADLVMLFAMFPDLFSRDVMEKNLDFYEACTIHDSSLSYCAHAQVCAQIGLTEKAYAFFRKAMEVDLCDNPLDSADGVHAAALGGIWLCVVQGFAGISYLEGVLRVSPSLPAAWNSMRFRIHVRGTRLKVKILKSGVEIACETPPDAPLDVEVYGKRYRLQDSLRIAATP